MTLLYWLDSASAPSTKALDLDELTPPDPKTPFPTNTAAQTSGADTNPYAQKKRQIAATRNVLGGEPGRKPTSRTSLPLALAVSQDLTTIAWAWRGHLYITPVEKPAVESFNLPQGVDVVPLNAGFSHVILQASDGRILYLDYKYRKGVTPRELAVKTGSCEFSGSGRFLLTACSSGILSLFDFSLSDPKETRFLNEESRSAHPGFTALAVSPDGAPAIATDQGSVVVWTPQGGGEKTRRELQSPGVAQTLTYDGHVALAGGGFRGIFLLEEGNKPQLVVGDVAGVTLQGVSGLKFDTKGKLSSGKLVVATREGATRVSIGSTRHLNDWGLRFVLILPGFWVLVLIVIPGLRIWVENIRRGREVRLRSELEQTLQRVSPPRTEGISSIDLPSPPEELIKACVAGDCVAFVGAGLSAQAGLPTWRSLIQALLSDVSKRGLLPMDQSQSLQEALLDGQADLVADEIVNALRAKEQSISAFLTQTFLRQDIRPTRAQNLLRSLNLSAVLTTNFDNLLDNTFSDRIDKACTHQDSDKLLERLLRHQFFLLKLYGSLDRPDSVLLAPFQYFEAMARNVLFSRFMESLFSTRTLLFVGASLEGIEAYLTGIKFPTARSQKHFALVAAPDSPWRAKADLLARRFGIQVLAFTATPGYPEIEQFLDQLAMAVRAKSGTGARTREISRIKRVILDNIGPFDHLELDLDHNWNILLGDNGVGKSTILKAIAVGIVGSDAAASAGHLIKVGKEAYGARIELQTSQGTSYVTEIRRGDKTVVESAPSRPLEPERWLALGFPPLRSFSLAPVTDLPPKGLQRLTSQDLMPLISGEVDPRLDQLKAWIVDLHLRDVDRRASDNKSWSFFRKGETPTQFSNLRDQFFEVIRRLTPGLTLGKVEIDVDKKQVLVETDDGILPIELVSQGTQSLLGWVGILLQRLDGIYGDASEDRQAAAANITSSLLDQFAIVLMDEIDAHMHPKWQQIIVSKLKDLLPNCQVIATTHSPLIVVGMERKEVLLVKREGEDDKPKSRVVVTRPAHSLRGWGADQILTGSLFGLETVVDPTIHRDVERYTELAAKETRTQAEEAELQTLADRLKITRPEPKQREEARLAFKMIAKALEEQLENIPEEKRKKVIDEAIVQMEENVTGSRRPE